MSRGVGADGALSRLPDRSLAATQRMVAAQVADSITLENPRDRDSRIFFGTGMLF
jgi:hypothetical protein